MLAPLAPTKNADPPPGAAARPDRSPTSGEPAGWRPPSSSRAVLRNIGWLLTAQLLAGGGQFGLTVLLARHLGAERYGQWTFAFAFVALFAVLADFGFSMVAVRDLARDPSAAPRYLGNILALKVVLGVLLLGAMAAIEPLVRPGATAWILVMLLGGQVLLTSFTQFLFSVFRAHNRMEYETAARAFQTVLLLALAALLVMRGAGVYAFGWAVLGAAGASLAFTGALVVGRFARPALTVEVGFCRSLLREAWPVGLALACSAVYYYADSVMLGALGQTRALGWYGAAYAPILGLALLIGAIRNAYFPSQSRSRLFDAGERVHLLREYGKITAALAIPVAIGGPLLAKPLLLLLFGDEYGGATTALRLLFVASGVMFFSSYFGSELLAGPRQRTYLSGVGLGAAANLVMNAALIPAFSIEGAAAATLISEGLVCAFMWWQTRPGGVSLGDILWRTGVAAAVMAGALFAGMQVLPWYALAAPAVAVYLGVLYLLSSETLQRHLSALLVVAARARS